MRGYEEIHLGDNYVLELLWNRQEGAFGRIYFLQSKLPLVYEPVGSVLTYLEKADAEIFLDHWQGECYLSRTHFHDELIDELGKCLLRHTQSTEPFLLNVYYGERVGGTYREYGQVTQEPDNRKA